jgi:PAS domain S-box-containing protein
VKHFPFHTPNGFSQPQYLVVHEEEITQELKWEDNLIDGACLGEWILHHIIQPKRRDKHRFEVRLNGEPFSVLYHWVDNEVHLLFQSHFITLDTENTMMAMVLLNEAGRVIYYYNRNFAQLPYFAVETDWYLDSFPSFCNQSTTLTAISGFLNDAFEKKSNFFIKEFAIVAQNKIFIDCLPIQVNEQFFYCYLIKHNPSQQEMGLQLGIQEKKFNRIIDNFQLGLLEVNNAGIILNANQSFCKMSGYSLSELMGKDAGEMLLNDENRDMMRQINQKRSEGYTDAYELCIRNKKGEKKWWLISGAPNIDEQGNDSGSIGIHWDITLQKELEFSLQKDKQKAEASPISKRSFWPTCRTKSEHP